MCKYSNGMGRNRIKSFAFYSNICYNNFCVKYAAEIREARQQSYPLSGR